MIWSLPRPAHNCHCCAFLLAHKAAAIVPSSHPACHRRAFLMAHSRGRRHEGSANGDGRRQAIGANPDAQPWPGPPRSARRRHPHMSLSDRASTYSNDDKTKPSSTSAASAAAQSGQEVAALFPCPLVSFQIPSSWEVIMVEHNWVSRSSWLDGMFASLIMQLSSSIL
jgi:hypothetical protein